MEAADNGVHSRARDRLRPSLDIDDSRVRTAAEQNSLSVHGKNQALLMREIVPHKPARLPHEQLRVGGRQRHIAFYL